MSQTKPWAAGALCVGTPPKLSEIAPNLAAALHGERLAKAQYMLLGGPVHVGRIIRDVTEETKVANLRTESDTDGVDSYARFGQQGFAVERLRRLNEDDATWQRDTATWKLTEQGVAKIIRWVKQGKLVL